LKGIEGLDLAVQSALGDIEICDTSIYDAIDLPILDFDVKSSTTQTYVPPTSWSKVLMISDLADAIATYLQEGTFAETSDVGLFIATTRQAAFHSRCTSPPIMLYEADEKHYQSTVSSNHSP